MDNKNQRNRKTRAEGPLHKFMHAGKKTADTADTREARESHGSRARHVAKDTSGARGGYGAHRRRDAQQDAYAGRKGPQRGRCSVNAPEKKISEISREKTAATPRSIAVLSLMKILEEKKLSHIVLRDALSAYPDWTPRDRAFVTRLVEGTLEYTIQIDFILNKISKTHTKNMEPLVRTVLRMGSYQILYMDKVPDSAAINEAVELVKSQEDKVFFLSGFVNGVLRSVSRDKEIIFQNLAHTGKTPAYIRYSVPLWMYDALKKVYGREETERMLAWFLEGEKKNFVRFQDGHCEEMEGDIVHSEAFQRGEITIQDVASQQVGIEADPQPGDQVVDVCAAPGGKSCHIAALLEGTGHVDARDLTEAKVALIEQNIARQQLTNITTEVHDARTPDPTLLDAAGQGTADIVIADLPCSGLGILGKKPDIRFNASPEGIRELQKLQREILDTVCAYVKPGGKLLYSTCTLTKEENEDNREYILAKGGFTLLKERKFLPGAPSDGFYLTVFRKE